MKQKLCKSRWINRLESLIVFLDNFSLWWVGIVLLFVTFLPYLVLKQGSIFEIHDQLDETILSYVLNAKYLGTETDVFPELLGGINNTGMQPSAILFVPLYCIFPPLTAFLAQYAIVFLSGFMGMYFLVKRVTASSILATAVAACFCSLPVQPVYGLSVLGVPLLLYAFLCLYDQKNVVSGCVLLVFLGLTTHLVLIGYVVLGLWACYLLYMLIAKKKNFHVFLGFVLLMAVYAAVNHNLFIELIIGNSSYVSHREELVNSGTEFWSTMRSMFLESGQHAVSLHKKLILPICAMLAIEGAFIRRMPAKERRIYVAAVAVLAGLFGIAVLYGLCKSEAVAAWKNTMHGFLRYFQLERFYWLYPAGWYFEFALTFRVWWGEVEEEIPERNNGRRLYRVWQSPVCKLLTLIIVLIPTLSLIKVNCNFYMNINQINNGSGVTGYISWENYYAEDLMQQLEETIGRDISTYRIVHLGISPAPSLMHGFYTVDGYSNNYPLEYKHKFRQVIERELEKNEEIKTYFDTWGNRCYLFNSVTGTYYMVSKGSSVKYENLEFDMKALRELGCEYLFSGGEIVDAKDMGLEFMGYFETEKSYWGVWLYQLKD